jgi:hypothetical protein
MTDIERVLFATIDPETLIDGRPVMALTTMLYRVCDGDDRKYKEATRLVELFIAEALKRRTPT